MRLLSTSAVLGVVADYFLGEIFYLRRHGTNRVHGGLPDFVFGCAELARPAEMQLGAVLVADGEVHCKADELRHFRLQSAFFVLDAEKIHWFGHGHSPLLFAGIVFLVSI